MESGLCKGGISMMNNGTLHFPDITTIKAIMFSVYKAIFGDPKLVSGDQIQIRFNKLYKAGIKRELLARVYVTSQPKKLFKSGVKGHCVKGTCNVFRIALAKGEKIEILYHALGYVIQYRKFGVLGNDWAPVNALGKKYIELKDYKEDLDLENQNSLATKEQIAEWFADDVRCFLAQSLGDNNSSSRAGPEKTKEVDDFLEELIFKH